MEFEFRAAFCCSTRQAPGRASAEPKQSFVNRPEWSVLVTAWQKDGVLTREITSFRRLSDCYRRSEETHRLRLIEAKFIQQHLKSLGFEVVQLDRYGDTKLPVGLNAYMALKPNSTNARTNS